MSDQREQSIQQFDASYQADEKPPWDIDRPQAALEAVADQFSGHVLDVGCGTGEHALLAASRGLEAVGVDAAPTAIALANAKARSRGLAVRFIVADALELGSLGEQFDMFHTFDDDNRARYVRSLADAVSPDGHLFLLCFSDRQPGDWGPRRVSEEDLRASFAEGWRLDSVERTVLSVTFTPEDIQAWLATITRVPAS